MSIEFLMKKKNLEDQMEVEWDPAPILDVVYYQKDEKRVLASVDGNFLGYLYVIDLKEERPSVAIQVPKIPFCQIYFQEDWLTLASKKGLLQLRHRQDLSRELAIQAHDKDTGHLVNT